VAALVRGSAAPRRWLISEETVMTPSQAPVSCRTYLVRAIETQRIVGIFCARDSRELFRLVDEQVDPEECEYFELDAREGMFFDAQFIEVPLAEDDEDPTDAQAEPLYELDVESVQADERFGAQMTSELAERMNSEAGVAEWRLFEDADIQGA
jgi:hypothetical protein